MDSLQAEHCRSCQLLSGVQCCSASFSRGWHHYCDQQTEEDLGSRALPCHVIFWSDTVERDIDLLKEQWTPDVDAKPNVIPPKGLSPDWYLYEQIKPFCLPDDQDSVCPLPSVPRPGGSKHEPPHPEGTLPDPDTPASPPPPKRQIACAICHAVGHDRSCPDKRFSTPYTSCLVVFFFFFCPLFTSCLSPHPWKGYS